MAPPFFLIRPVPTRYGACEVTHDIRKCFTILGPSVNVAITTKPDY